MIQIMIIEFKKFVFFFTKMNKQRKSSKKTAVYLEADIDNCTELKLHKRDSTRAVKINLN